MTDGRWKSETTFLPMSSAIERADMAIRMNETAVMRKQKAMFPDVSIRALPLGNRRGSTRLTARLHRMSVRLLEHTLANNSRPSLGLTYLIGSNMASAMVVKSERDPELVAP